MRISCQMKFALLWPQHDMIGNHLSMISGSSGNGERAEQICVGQNKWVGWKSGR